MRDLKSKKCTKCGENKPLTEFYKNKAAKDGLQYECKSCKRKYRQENKQAIKERMRKYYEQNREAHNERNRKYYQENKQAIKERERKYRQENKQAIKERNRKYHQENKQAIKEIMRKYYQENKQAIKERERKYRQENRQAIKERKRKYRQENKQAIKERNRKYYEQNREASNERTRKYYKERYDNDPQFRTSRQLRDQTRRLGDFKNTTTIELVGCSAKEFWLMNGSPSIEELQELHIDHIVPLSWFNLENEDHLKVSNHYLNLQYLNSKDNKTKGDRYAGRPDNILGYKGEFDVDGYVAEILEKIKDLNLDSLK